MATEGEATEDRSGETRFAMHPLRSVVLGELHARPFRLVEPPRVVLHYAFEVVRGASKPDRVWFDDLCRSQGVPGPGRNARHHVVPFGSGTLKWERHSEFTTYSWDGPLAGDQPPLTETPIGHPFGANFVAPGPLLVAVRAELVRDTGDLEAVTRRFEPASLCVSGAYGGRAVAITDFRQDGDGRSRIVVLDRGLTAQQAGALLQRLLEIETSRLLALLGLPEAQTASQQVSAIETRLAVLARGMTHASGLDEDRRLLDELMGLSAELEAQSAAWAFRAGASRAYDRI
eukprot:gene27608-30564_t